MTIRIRGSLRSTASAGGVLLTLVALTLPAAADIRATTNIHNYHVVGSTSDSLVAYLRSNPFHGPKGPALANIRPTYALNVETREAYGMCSPANVTLNLTFDMTLPKASEATMGADTQYAWRTFVNFARKHEETHRAIYLDCARTFLSEAAKLSTSGCESLKAQAAQLLAAENRACDLRQQAFDAKDGPRVLGLALFKSIGGGLPVEASAAPIGGATPSYSLQTR